MTASMTHRSWLGLRLLPIFLWTSLAQDDENGFDFGSGCEPGTGKFSRVLSTQYGTSVLGIIPEDKYGVRVDLISPVDIDIQLLDIFYNDTFDEGKAIIAYCESPGCNYDTVFGVSPTEVTGVYERPGIDQMKITYSGYNGQNNALGNEFIEFAGRTTTDIKMRVYAYKTGTAAVNYKWDRSQTACCRGVEECPGVPFNKFIKYKELVTIGEIPVGKVNVRIYLKAELDVDVQIYDQSDTVGGLFPEGKAIIGYCESADCNFGFLAGPDRESYTYKGVEYVYSGYNGDGGVGNEYIEILGTTNTPLTMKAYGYAAGTAYVTYSWYELAESDVRNVCYDTVGWLDIDDYDCTAYTSCANEGWKDRDPSYYEQWANADGLSALDACCDCGKVSTCSEPDTCAGLSNECGTDSVAAECVCTCSDFIDLGQCLSTRAIKVDKIVGGQPAEPREFPFLVSLQSSDDQHFCGGTLISPTWVLTAAHCEVSYLDNVLIGAHKLSESNPVPGGCTERIKVKRRIPHPDYDSDTTNHDVMLLELMRPSSFPAAKLVNNPANEATGTFSQIVGWGSTLEGNGGSDVLQKATVPIADQNLCADNYRPYSITIDPDSMICAGFETGGRDSCQGDSGGPLLNAQSQELVGIVSFGIGCAREDFFGVYARISDHLNWIESNAVLTNVAPTDFPTPGPTTLQPTRYPTTARPTMNPTRPLPPTFAPGSTDFPTVNCSDFRQASPKTRRTLKQIQDSYDYNETKFYGVAEVFDAGSVVVCSGVMVATNMFLTNEVCKNATYVFLSVDNEGCFSSLSVVGREMEERWGAVLRLNFSLPSSFPLVNINTLPVNQLAVGSELIALGQVKGEPAVQLIEMLDPDVCRDTFGTLRTSQVCAGFQSDSIKLSRQGSSAECNTVPGTPLLKLVDAEYYVVAMSRGKEELPAAGCDGEAAGIYERVDALVDLANLLSCVDMLGWVDIDGDNCSVYISCSNTSQGWMDMEPGYYDQWANSQGLAATDACCECGGGGGNWTSSTSAAPASGSCFTSDGEYTGLLSEAMICEGSDCSNIITTPCLDWSQVYWNDDYILDILSGTSYCRNPDGDPGGPWCIVGENAWAYCDVGTPEDPNCGSFASPTTQPKTNTPTISPAPPSGEPAGAVEVTGNCYMSGGCFHSPNFPEEYANNENCILDGWQGLEVELHLFATEKGFDFLSNGYYNYSGLAGIDVNLTFVVEDLLRFTSDYSETRAGFKICPLGTPHQPYFSGDCEYDGGCLRTPNYGQYSYSSSMYCFLDGWQGESVSGAYSTEAGFDFLIIGENSYDGDGTLQNVKVTGPIMFVTDGSIEADGFEICNGASPTMPTLPPSTTPSAAPGAPSSPPSFDPAACDETLSGTNDINYRGCQTTTRSGKVCQAWSSQTPHEHGMTPANYPGKGLGDHNYCRNPDNDATIWCYTTDAAVRWEFCDPLPALGTPTPAPPSFAPPTAECQGHNDCSAGEYCRATLECAACGWLTAGCDTFDNLCCSSTAFTTACPNHELCSSVGGASGVVPDACKPGSSFMSRIVGGTDAIKNEFPWIVSVQTSGGFHFCGGSLISPTKVLTAAHCRVSAGDKIVIGAHSLENANDDNECIDTIVVESSVAHESYQPSTLDNDIMIVTLSKPTWWPHFIDLATGSELAADSDINVAGWGNLSPGGDSPDILQKVTTKMQSRADCRAQYGQEDITNNMICAGEVQGGKDSCQGDSGGPMFSGTGIAAVQYGVVSWGISCADARYFGVYTNLVQYTGPGEWICQKINNDHKTCQ